jgi:hypothetical protein
MTKNKCHAQVKCFHIEKACFHTNSYKKWGTRRRVSQHEVRHIFVFELSFSHITLFIYVTCRHMQTFVTKIVNMMKGERLFYPQGGPIIMSQVSYILGTLYKL